MSEVRGVDVEEVEGWDHAGDGPVDGCAGRQLDGFYGGRLAGGQRNEGVADLEGAGFEVA